jgi:homoserine kinase type II
MAVYTEVEDDELAAFVASYDIGSLTSCKGIAEGVENSNYLVTTTKGRFILTLYEKRVSVADLPFFLGLMQHLAAAGIRCPTPLKDADGAMLKTLAGRPAAMVTFLEGVWLRRPQVVHCAALGTALAELHAAGRDFALRRPNALSLPGWHELAGRLGADADKVAPGLRSLIAEELAFLDAQWPRHLPDGVIHADLFPNNVFFLGDRLSGLIDFYFACNDFLAYDLAVCVNAWCFDAEHAFEPEKSRALVAAYAAARPLEAGEVAVFPVLARGAALRFLLTRAYDWLHTADSALVNRLDPGEYIAKLRFHRAATGPETYGLRLP